MENEKWSCKRKFSETNHSETENFGSISSHSERYSDDKDAIEASPHNNTQSPDALSKASIDSKDVNDDIMSLTDKLSAALVDVSAKEDLVKQHSVVAEEAIAGWEKSENEVVVLKQKLEDEARQNSALEDRLSRLDGALKECVKQLRQAREEQEQKIVEAVEKTTRDWEATKFELESQLLEFQDKAKSVLKIEDLEKENSALKLELSIYVEEMEIRTIERDLSTEAAETASKQYLESIKKLARLEAECRRLKVIGCKSCFVSAENPPPVSTYVETLRDSQSNSWTSALVTDFDQLKNEKVISRNVPGSCIEIDLMDDFLEMERLAALPKTNSENQCLEPKAITKQSNDGDNLLKAELEAMINRTAELEEKLENLEVEKAELETALGKSQESLKALELQLRDTEVELLELRTELCMANEVKQHLKSQLSSMETDAEMMSAQIDSLVAEIEKQRTLTEQVSVNANESKQLLESQLISIEAEAQMMSAKIDALEKFEVEKAELETALAKSQESLEVSELQLRVTETELAELRTELCMANEVKQHLESQLSSMETNAEAISAKIDSLVAEIEKERTLTEQVSINANESKQLLESQLISIEAEARMMSAKIDSLEKFEVEKAELETALAESQKNLEASELQLRDTKSKLAEWQTELCMANEVKQHLESKLSSMETDAEMMSAKIDSLVAEIEKERALSEKVLVDANKSKQLLESQLISIEAEARLISAKIDSLETMEVEKVELETALSKSRESLESSELQLRDSETELAELRSELCMANEVKQHLESQLSSMETDAEMMSAKIDSLEAEIEKERTLSQQVSANANETKQLLESQLISIEAEARMMSTKIDLLETEVKKERSLSSQISVRCRELEDTLSRKQHKAKLQQTANSNVESKIKQEDLAVAAGKLAECQKTIASLGQQLKSLATLEDFLIDTTNIPEFSRDPETPIVSADRYGHSVNKVGKTPPSSFSSSSVVSSNPGSSEKNRNGFAEFLIRSKNGLQLEI